MPNINDISPQDVTLATPDLASGNVFDQPDSVQSAEEHFSTPGQMLATGLEGAAEGVVGPLAPAIERGFGVPAENIRARAQVNPVTHAVGKTAGFVGSLAVPGLSEYGLASQVGKVGEGAAALTGLGAEGASVLSKLAATGIKTGAEFAALATSDELSKAVTQDPGQTLGSAAINVGLSGLIGGVGGAVVGSVSPLWQKAKNVTGVNDLLSDFMQETQTLQAAKDPALAAEHAIADGLDPSQLVKEETRKVTPGVALARWVNEKGASLLANSAGETAASTVGAGLGALVGHPFVGAWMGERVLSPLFSSLAKPLAENAIDAGAAKAAVDYVGYAIKGQKLLSQAVDNVFKPGAEVLAKDLIPDAGDRERLKASIDYASMPQNALQIGGSLGHYLPEHQSAIAQSGAQAINFLNGLKPTQPIASPMDEKPPPSKIAQSNYDRALNIAQQPLMALKHLKDGTLLPLDVQTLRTIYPALHDTMVSHIVQNMIQSQNNGQSIPYHQRLALNLFVGGKALDSTMTPSAMQAIIGSANKNQDQASANPQSGVGKTHSGAAVLSQINKVNANYATPSQARERDRSR